MSQKVVTLTNTADFTGTFTDTEAVNNQIILGSSETQEDALELDSLASGIITSTGAVGGTTIMNGYAYSFWGSRISKVRLSDMAKISDIAFTGVYAGFVGMCNDGTYLYAVSTNGGGTISDQDFVWTFDADLTQVGTKKQFYSDGWNTWGALKAIFYVGGNLWVFGNQYLYVCSTSYTKIATTSISSSMYYRMDLIIDGDYVYVSGYQTVVKITITDITTKSYSPNINGAVISGLRKYGTKIICRVTYGTEEIRFLDPSDMSWSASARTTPTNDLTDNQNPWLPKLEVEGDRLFVGWATDYLNSLIIQYDLTTDPVTYVGQLQLGIHNTYLTDECGVASLIKWGDYLIVDYQKPNSTTSVLRKIALKETELEYSASGSYSDSVNLHIDNSYGTTSSIHFHVTTPEDTSVVIYAKKEISDAWIEIADTDAIPGMIYKDLNLDPIYSYWKADLATSDTTATPSLDEIVFTMDGTATTRYTAEDLTTELAGETVGVVGAEIIEEEQPAYSRPIIGFVADLDEFNQAYWRTNNTGSEAGGPCVEIEANGIMAFQVEARANKTTTAVFRLFIPSTYILGATGTPKIELYDEILEYSELLTASGAWQSVTFTLMPTVDTIYKVQIVMGSYIKGIWIKLDSITVTEA